MINTIFLLFLSLLLLVIGVTLIILYCKKASRKFQSIMLTVITLIHIGLNTLVLTPYFTAVKHGCNDITLSIFTLADCIPITPIRSQPVDLTKPVFIYRFDDETSHYVYQAILAANVSVSYLPYNDTDPIIEHNNIEQYPALLYHSQVIYFDKNELFGDIVQELKTYVGEVAQE